MSGGQDLERFAPGLPWPELAYEHVARYLLAAALCRGLETLDAGCGQGYGTVLLSSAGARVVGLERDASAIARGRLRRWVAGDLQQLPFRPGSFDRVVAFEVLEHLQDPERFLDQVVRCLSPRGLLLISTPDRLIYSERSGYRNPYHVREYSEAELRESLGRRFDWLRLWRQGIAAGCAFWPAAAEPGSGRWEAMDLSAALPPGDPPSGPGPYLVAACAHDRDVLDRAVGTEALVYLDRSGWMLRHHQAERVKLLAQEQALKQELERAAAHQAQIEADNRAKQAEIDKASRHIQHVESTLARVQSHLDHHARRLAELERGS